MLQQTSQWRGDLVSGGLLGVALAAAELLWHYAANVAQMSDGARSMTKTAALAVAAVILITTVVRVSLRQSEAWWKRTTIITAVGLVSSALITNVGLLLMGDDLSRNSALLGASQGLRWALAAAAFSLHIAIVCLFAVGLGWVARRGFRARITAE